MKTLYIITSSFPPKNIVGALRPYRLAKESCKRGWRVIVISQLSYRRESLDYSLLQELGNRTEIHHLEKHSPFVPSQFNNRDTYKEYFSRHPMSGFYRLVDSHPKLRRIWGAWQDLLGKVIVPDINLIFVPFYVLRVIKLLKNAKDPVLLTTSPPHSIHLVGLTLRKLTNVPWLVDLRDPWDDYPETGRFDITNPIERLLEKKVVTVADAVISTTKTYTRILKQRHPHLTPNKFYTCTNCYDDENIKAYNEVRKNRFVISYTGIFYPEKDPFTFFRALRSWLDKMDRKRRSWIMDILKVQLIGSRSKAVEKVIGDLALQEVVRFIDRVPHREAIQLTLRSDMALISTGLGKKTRPGWLPSKLFEYLGCRVPILAITPEGELAEIIRETSSGYVITNEDHVQISTILEAEINRKFSSISASKSKPFSFGGVLAYEARNVINTLIDIIQRVS